MYRIRTHDQAREAVSALPGEALVGYAEALGMLKLFPWSGPPFREDNPDGNIRTLSFGSGGLVTYLVLERDQEVHVLEVQWVS
ncbi:MAG: hypothetical protein ACRDTG_12165 [Pseudonocardiaceae bacterium]